MKKYLFAALALTALVACSKDPIDEVLTSSQKSVTISIANMASNTRAATPNQGGTTLGVTEGTKASTELSRIYILFANQGGEILQVNTITANNQQYHLLPAQVTQIAAVGNVDSAPTAGQTLSDYETLWKDEDVDAAYTDLVVYSGGEDLTPDGTCTVEGHEYNHYTAEITVAPYMARIEVTQISCTNFGTQYNGFDAIGVTGMKLAGGAVTNVGDTANKPYTFTLGTFANDAAVSAVPTANYVMKQTTDILKPTGDGIVWSWNIVPQSTTDNTLTTSLYVSGWDYTTSVPVREVIINSYKNGSDPITAFAGGNIYRFGINFSYENIEAVNDYLCADVTVTIQPWTIVETTVGFNTPTPMP